MRGEDGIVFFFLTSILFYRLQPSLLHLVLTIRKWFAEWLGSVTRKLRYLTRLSKSYLMSETKRDLLNINNVLNMYRYHVTLET